ncbi:MAG: prolyl oligopeptidase family serine peptidase [Massilia sp.]
MPSIIARCASIILLALATATQAQAQAVPAHPSLESFFGPSPFNGAVLSPNAKYLAVKTTPKGDRVGLFVIDLATDKGNVVAQFNDTDISTVHWVNDERLIFNTHDKQQAVGDQEDGPGLFAVNRDGTMLRQLAEFGGDKDRGVTAKQDRNLLPYHTFMLPQRGAQNSEYVYVGSPVPGFEGARLVNLLRLDTLTGHTTQVKRPPDVQGWLLDNKGEPRIAIGVKKDVTSVYYRETVDADWVKINTTNTFGIKGNSFMPLAFGPGNTLYVQTNNGGADKEAVYSYDYTTGKLSDKPLIETAGYDFSGDLITNGDKVLGMNFATDAHSTMWFDDKMKAMQDKVDGLLRTTINLLAPSARPETPWIMVVSYSDVQPTLYHLYNSETGVLRKVGEARPGIDPAQMGHQQQVTYKARDGMDIPALLTLPKGQNKNLPLVLLIHGGPYVRGSLWGWAPESQFLASRGYAVLEPSYRGTTGFGAKHFKAGWKQWGLAMQDDMADGVKWAIDKGIVDGNRVCIAGASYGGYATLMGLVKHPDIYKCGINWVGVSDITLLSKGDWTFKSDMGSAWRDYGMPDMIGDVIKDAEQLKATSPLFQYKKITRPLLMAYGGADRRVPAYHGDKLMAVLKPVNPNVEMILYPEEGHGWALPKNRYDFYGRMEKFLEKNIGKP